MRTIKRRIGRDLSIDIKTLTNGSPTDLSGRAIKVEVIHSAFPSRQIELPFTTEKNAIKIKWYGTEQSHLGEYRLVIWENFGIPGQSVADLCTTITLVDSTCFESDIDSVEYYATSVDLGIINLEVGVRGDSAYETWLQLGHEGSEEDFINWLQEPARIIAEQVATSEAERIKAEAARAAAEKARQTAESERATAEAARIKTESDRVVAENSRDKAETSRSKSETSRQEAEKLRIAAEESRDTAESGRKKSELVRQTSESDRQQSEIVRGQAESVRKQSEDTRIASEQVRTTAESARVNAEKTRVAAESARQIAEAKRQQDTTTAIQNATTATTAANDAAGKANAAANNLSIEDYPEFSAEKSYIVGEVVRYSGKLYRFTVAHPAGAWVGTDAETTSIKEELDRAVALKANVDGYYETMRVGTADNLTARGEASEEIIMNRTAGGNNAVESGDALIKSIKGNSLVRNQLIQKPYSTIFITIEDNNGELYVIPETKGNRLRAKSKVTPITGHLYLQMVRIKTPGTTVRFANYLGGLGLVQSGTTSLSWVWLCVIAQAISSEKTLIQIMSDDNTPYWIRDGSFNLIDLTQMFGAGNEPATLEEFARRLGYDSIEQLPYIPYNEGEIVSCKAEGIRTTDAEGDTYERKWASTLQKYFPDGLKSAGTIYDEITPTKAVKRICSVKMNSLGWVTHNDEFRIFRADIANRAEPANYEDRKNGLLSNAYKPSKTVGIGLEMEDPSMLRGSGVIYIKDSRYSDLESFINHFTENDELYYELATPEEYEYDELNLTERVAQGGKEEAIVSEGVLSTPLKIDVVYPIDTYGTIVNNKKNIGNISQLQTSAKTDLVVAINELKTQLTQLSAATEPALMSLRNDVDGLISDLGGAEDMRELPAIAGQPLILFGHGAPAKGKVPDNWNKLDPKTGKGYEWNGTPSALGQQYLDVDASPGGLYIAARDTNMGLKWINC